MSDYVDSSIDFRVGIKPLPDSSSSCITTVRSANGPTPAQGTVPINLKGKPFHFIGIGGIGMSALAYILAERGLPVSGSDLRLNSITDRLKQLGANIFSTQEATNLEFFRAAVNVNQALASTSIGGSPHPEKTLKTALETTLLPQVVCSTAINPRNPEYQAAVELGCPIFHRSDLLAAFMEERSHSIAVAGTHGKTTTSSLIGYLLLQGNLDPTIIVGGEVDAWGGNARSGQSEFLVAEADESDGSLVKFRARIGVVTNMELDHTDHYKDLDQVIQTFQTFAQHCQVVVGCIDCSRVRTHLHPNISYSLQTNSGADYTVDQVSYGASGTQATVWERGVPLGQMTLKLLGRHNLSNALAAIAVGRLAGLDFETIAKALGSFEGAHRRFERRGYCGNISFVDDYAHHPSEVRATLAAAQLQVQGTAAPTHRRVVAIFQPHRYSRTLTFLEEFAQSFKDADIVIITDIYSAGEPNPGQISGQQVADAIAAHHSEVHYQPSLQSVNDFLRETLKPGDLALFLGAGNVNQVIPEIMAFYQCLDPNLETGTSQQECGRV